MPSLKKTKMKMYVWYDEDATNCWGMFCVLAENIEQARKLVLPLGCSIDLANSRPHIYIRPKAVVLIK